MKLKKPFFIMGIAMLYSFFNMSAQKYIAEFKDNNGLWGYVSSTGEVIIPGKYDHVTPFCEEGFALIEEKNSMKNKFIDINGKELELNVKSNDLLKFSEGMAAVKINDKWGFVDTTGKLAIPCAFRRVNIFSEGYVWATGFNNIICLLDKKGHTVDLTNYNIVDYLNFSEGLAAVKIDGKWGFINHEGKLVIQNKFLKTGYFSGEYCWVRIENNLTGFINKKGEYIIQPKYIACDRFDPVSGLARVKTIDQQWFYVDTLGNGHSLNSVYMNDFSEGLCRVIDPITKKVGFMDKEGKWVIQPTYDRASDFLYGLCRVKIGELWGLIDKNGNYLIHPRYVHLENFYPVY